MTKTKHKIKALIFVIISFVILIFSQNVFAVQCGIPGGYVVPFDQYKILYQDSSGKPMRWELASQPLIINYMIEYDSAPADLEPTDPQARHDFIETAIGNAFQTWGNELVEDQQIGALMDFNETVYNANNEDQPGYITIRWAEDNDPGCAGLVLEDDITAHIVSGTIKLNVNYRWGDYETNGEVWDLQGVTTHEIGHVLGLAEYLPNHNKNAVLDYFTPPQTMEGTAGTSLVCTVATVFEPSRKNQCVSKAIRTLQEYDKKGLHHLYFNNTNNEPSKSVLLTPTDGSLDIDPTSDIILEWGHISTTSCSENDLNWSSGDPDCNAIKYKLTITEDRGVKGYDDDLVLYDDYIGSQYELSPQTFVTTNNLNLNYGFKYNRSYWWALWSHDDLGKESPSPDNWLHFSTKSSNATNQSPDTPSSLKTRINNIGSGHVNVTLSWNGSDPDAEPLKYKLIIRQYTPGGQPIFDEYVSPDYDDTKPYTYTLDADSIYYWSVLAEDDDGFPSKMADWQSLSTESIIGAEYFIDQDPGEGAGTSIPAPDDGTYDNDTESVTFDVDTTELGIGYHAVYLRFKNADGIWGKPRPLANEVYVRPPPNFQVTGDLHIVAAEYFIDTDPGEGNATSLDPADTTFDDPTENILFDVDTSSLDQGIHKLYVRMLDSNGNWGVIRQTDFEISHPNIITAAEYFIDNDPGEGLGTTLDPKDIAFDEATEQVDVSGIDSSSLQDGLHTVYIRMKDAYNHWGEAKAYPITIGQPIVYTLDVPIQSNDGNGKVPLSIIVADQSGTICQVKVEYSTNQAVWYKATLDNANFAATYGTPAIDNGNDFQIGNIATDTGLNLLNVVWLSASDIPNKEYSSVVIRFTVNNGIHPTNTTGSNSFPVDNIAPLAPVLIPYSPDPACDATPELDWYGAVGGAVRYRIQVSHAPNFTPTDIDLTDITTSKFTPSSNLASGAIYWRAFAIDAKGNESPPSSDDSFTLNVDTTAPTVSLAYGSDPATIGPFLVKATFSEPVETTPLISIGQPGTVDIANTPMRGGGSVWTYIYEVHRDNGAEYVDGVATVTVTGGFDCGGNENQSATNNNFTIDTSATPGTIVGAEYFIDEDPGEGAGIFIPTPDDGTYDSEEESVTVVLDTADLSIGYHTVYVRFKNADGTWGMARPLLNDVYVTNPPNFQVTGDLNIVAAEYFIDEDPGEGNGNPVPAKDGAFDDPVEEVELADIDTSSLEAGIHTIYLRMRDSNGDWEPLRQYDFEVFLNSISYAEYYIDDDPGLYNGTEMTPDDGDFGDDVEDFDMGNISISGIGAGLHTLCVKVFDVWGLNTTECTDFTICEESYHDGDTDGYGDPEDVNYSCTPPDGYIYDSSDCNDNNFFTNPGAPEICDGEDNNCNKIMGEGLEDCDENGMVAYWKFDENGTDPTPGEWFDVYDKTANNNHGTLGATGETTEDNDPGWAIGKSGSSLNFDGNNDYLQVADDDSLDLTTAGSIEVWAKKNVQKTYQMYVTKGHSQAYQLMDYSNTGRIALRWGSNSNNLITDEIVSTGSWQHIVATYDGSYLKVYINGKLSKNVPYTTNAMANTTPVRIGARDDGYYFDGSIDEVGIYTRALTTEEVEYRYLKYGAGISRIAANDTSGGGMGLQAGDQVVVMFNTDTKAPIIDYSNIDTVLALNNGHSWKDGSANIGGAVWSTTTNPNDTLTITLSDTGGLSTVIVGDTATLDGVTIKSKYSDPIIDSATIIDTYDYGLVAYYPFNGNANDESGNGNNGAVHGATLTTDRFGNEVSAYNFDGNDYITIGDKLDMINSNLTLSVWIKSDDYSHSAKILNKGQTISGTPANSGYSLRFVNPELRFSIADDNEVWSYVSYPISQLPSNRFLHIVGVFTRISNNQGNMFLYVNSTLVSSDTITFIGSDTNIPLAIGALDRGQHGSTSEFFNGIIDDIRIYDRALSESEIQNLYQEGQTKPDIQVSSVNIPPEAWSGQQIDIGWRVTNTGPEITAGNWQDCVYLSADNQIGEDTQLVCLNRSVDLDMNEYYDRIATVTIPSVSDGDYWILVKADDGNTLAEIYETNNDELTGPLSIRVVPCADLEPGDISISPDTVEVGSTMSVDWIVTNIGDGATNAPFWLDRIYLSSDLTLDGNDTAISPDPQNPMALNSGEAYSQEAQFMAPADLDGNYYVIVETDVQRSASECNEDNNIAVSSTTILIVPQVLPILTVTDIQVNPAEPWSGDQTTVTWRITNAGQEPTGPFSIDHTILLSIDDMIDAPPDLPLAIGVGRLSANLGAGEASEQISATVNIPHNVWGDYHLIIWPDRRQQVDLDRSPGHIPIYVQPSLTADLVIDSIDVPNTAKSGQPIHIEWTVRNAASEPTITSRWNDKVYLSVDNDFQTTDDNILFATFSHNGILNFDETYIGEINVSLSVTASGPYHIFVQTDTDNNVYEGDWENNNVASAPDPVVVSYQPPDLQTDAVAVLVDDSPVVSVTSGSLVTLKWTVTNGGTGDVPNNNWRDRIYISEDDTLDSGDRQLTDPIHTGNLAVSESYEGSASVKIPIDITGPEIYIFACADAGNVVYESADDNNCGVSTSFEVVWAAPDLVVKSFSTSQGIPAGEAINVSWSILNIGGPTDVATWYDKIYLSEDRWLDSEDTELGDFIHSGALGYQESYSLNIEDIAIPIDISGTYYVIIETDAPNPGVVAEFNENNNDSTRYNSTDDTDDSTTEPIPPEPPLTLGVDNCKSDLVVNSVDAPATAISGQLMAVNWTVTNLGNKPTNRSTWSDVVYFSRDQYLDRDSDIYLGYLSHNGTLDAGVSYDPQATLDVRITYGLAGPYYVFVVTDSNNNVCESDETNNEVYHPTAVIVELPLPVDLVVTEISVPSNGLLGESVTIQWTVRNEGGYEAKGHWGDSVYISADTTWDIGDKEIGRVRRNGPLASGGEYTESLTARLPGVVSGVYNIIVRTDIHNELIEPDGGEQNNILTSTEQINVDCWELTLGVPDNSHQLSTGTEHYYKIPYVPTGEDMLITLDSSDDSASTELYIRYEAVPDMGRYDFAYSISFAADHEIMVPVTKIGTYYLLVRGDSIPNAPTSYTLEAHLLPFDIFSITPDSGGNAGEITTQIFGSQLTSTTTARLIASDNTVIAEANPVMANSTEMYVTFDLHGANVGLYDVEIEKPGEAPRVLEDAFEVKPGVGPQLQANILAPQIVRPGQKYTMWIEYENIGDADMPAPLFYITNSANVLMQIGSGGRTSDIGLPLLGVSMDGPASRLIPGRSHRIPISFTAPSEGSVRFSLTAFEGDDTLVDWDVFEPLLRPPYTDDDEWLEYWQYVTTNTGKTWNEVLGNVRLVLNGIEGTIEEVSDFIGVLTFTLGIMEQSLPSSYIPESADVSQTSFKISSLNPTNDVQVESDHCKEQFDPISPNRCTYIITHGWNASCEDNSTLANNIMATCSSCNVLLVDWKEGAASGNPWGSAKNINQAAEEAYNRLKERLGENFNWSNVTYIGHSFGNAVNKEIASLSREGKGGKAKGNAIILNPATRFGGADTNYSNIYEGGSISISSSSWLDAAPCPQIADDDFYLPTFGTGAKAHSAAREYLTNYIQENAVHCDPWLGITPFDMPDLLPGWRKCLDKLDELSGMIRYPVAGITITVIRAIDPNDKIGPNGFGDMRFVPIDSSSQYMINFENVSDASAPAKQVTITDQMNADLDWRTFQLGEITFGDTVIEIPGKRSHYVGEVSLDNGLIARINAGLNIQTGMVTWRLTAIDPETGEISTNPLLGLLPPNDPETHSGEGRVTFFVRPKPDVSTGTEVTNTATIIFDNNAPIETNEVFNTVDAVAPSSTVETLTVQMENPDFTVAWSGQDDEGGSGLANYDIYVSDNGEAYTVWLGGTTGTSSTFTGEPGHEYRFYSIARDNAGNNELASNEPDATTTVANYAPSNPNPSDGAEDIPINTSLSWDAGYAANTHDLYIWEDGDSQPTSPTASALTETNYTPSSSLLYSTTYHWQVVAWENSNDTSGPIWTFTTACQLNSYYHDVDNDDYGNPDDNIQACSAPDGYVTDNTDCDDNDPARYPGHPEICDEKDNNCDGSVPANEIDNDGDGVIACKGDCDDNDNSVYPGAQEMCDGVGIIVPAYFYPTWGDPSANLWDDLAIAATQAPTIAIMNPNSGPGDSHNPDYVRAVDEIQVAGGKVIGYVHTSYGNRPIEDCKGEVDKYFDWYNVDGIFFDEMSNSCDQVNYYKELYDYVVTMNWGIVVGNPGTDTDECYMDVATILNIFEGTGDNYQVWTPSTWIENYPPSLFSNLTYEVSVDSTMEDYSNSAKSRNIGWIYITDDILSNPWDTLPGYWDQFIELCKGTDNNCDGEINEGFDFGKTCPFGIGSCEDIGFYMCSADAMSVDCAALEEGPPNDEICDGLDNDCDGEYDEICDLGDINVDGAIDIDDIFCLFKYIMGRSSCLDDVVVPSAPFCDINGSGKVDIDDVFCLFKHIMGRPSCMDGL